MLYLNGKRLNTHNTDTKYEYKVRVQDFHDVITKAKEYYGDYVILETKHRPHPDPKTGFPVYPGTRGLLLRSTLIDDENNTEEWIYSDHTLAKKEGTDQLNLDTPSLLIQKGQYPIEIKRNPDLVYYILTCGKVGKTEGEGKKFHIRDTIARSKNNAEVRRLESKVAYMIYSSIPEKNLLTLAKSWGVSGVDSKHIDVVREELHTKVEAEEKALKSGNAGHRGFEEFVESAEVKFHDKVAAMCMDAEEKKHLVYDAEQRSWFLNYKDGAMPHRIKELSGDEFGDPMGSIVNFLASTPDERRRIENVMNSPLEPQVEPSGTSTPAPMFDLTLEQIQKETQVAVLKKHIRTYCPGVATPNTMKRDDAKEILFQALAASAAG